MKGRLTPLIVLSLALMVLAGCAPTAVEAPVSPTDEVPLGEAPTGGARITGATLNEESAGSRSPFTLEVEDAGGPVGIDFRGTLVQGTLRLELLNAEDAVSWDLEVSTPGPFAINTVIKPEEAGRYELQVVWPGAVQATYNLRWQPEKIEVPEVRPVALLPGVGMTAVALGFVLYAAVRHLGWKYLGFGALAWVVTVVLKFVWAVPINAPVYEALTGSLPETVANVVFYLYVGALTGVFEVALLWLFLNRSPLGTVPWKRALTFGIGFGAMEALLLGGSALANSMIAMTRPDSLPLAALEQFARVNNPLYGLAPVTERFFTVLIHILSNVLLFYGVVTKRSSAFWIAFAYKTGIDTVAAFGQFWGIDTLGRLWLIEAIVAMWGAAGWLGTRRVREAYPPEAG